MIKYIYLLNHSPPGFSTGMALKEFIEVENELTADEIDYCKHVYKG